MRPVHLRKRFDLKNGHAAPHPFPATGNACEAGHGSYRHHAAPASRCRVLPRQRPEGEPTMSCALASRRNGDRLAGTATTCRTLLFLGIPKPLWRRSISDELGRRLTDIETFQTACVKAGVLARAFDEAYAGGGAAVAVRAYPSGVQATVPWGELADFVTSMSSNRASVKARQALYVCCHGTRDACCARYGFAAFRALQSAMADDAGDVEIRQASHLGGDRFAATILDLPSGNLYGHVSADSAPEFLRAVRQGTTPLRFWRGSIFDDEITQVAKYKLSQVLGVGIDEIETLTVDTRGQPLGRVRGVLRIAGGSGQMRFAGKVRNHTESTFASCSDFDSGKVFIRKHLEIDDLSVSDDDKPIGL